MTDHTGIMLCGHGSRDANAVAEFEALVRRVRERLPGRDVEFGFLEFARPIIRDGLDKLRARGATDVLAIPGMLFAAGHAKNDIPSVLNTYQARHPELTIRYGRELAIDAKLLRAAGARIDEALERAGATVSRHDTLLMVVGRGTSDSDANSNVSKVARLLWEGFGFGWGETSYSGVTFPLVEPGLEHAARLGYRRIIVFPYFLFTGVLVKAPYLNDHPLVVEAFLDRIGEIGAGANLMNCQMCKYREQILGFEDEVGLAQASHHHHAEGIGTDADHGHEHSHDHHHGEGGDHGHHPYPHADHPHGPVTLRPDNSGD